MKLRSGQLLFTATSCIRASTDTAFPFDSVADTLNQVPGSSDDQVLQGSTYHSPDRCGTRAVSEDDE